ncbi:MAG: lipocalin family protein [Fimbriimonadaceae bacterium]|nr:lipocalin family protein [Fimbriimonadaceae bacterium]
MRSLFFCLVLFVTCLANAEQPAIVGTWRGSLLVEKVSVDFTFEFRADLTYRFDAKAGDQVVTQTGTYAVTGNSLVLKDSAGSTTTYDLSVADGTMTLSGGDLKDRLVLKQAQTPATKGDQRLVGQWVGEVNEFHKVIVVFTSKGAVTIGQSVADVAQPSIRGSYRIKGDKIVFEFEGKESEEPLALDGETLQLEFKGSGKITFHREPGSIEKVAALEAKQDEENAAWRRRIKIEPLTRLFEIASAGEVPQDGDFEKAKKGANVFAEIQLYFRDGLQTYVSRSNPEVPKHSAFHYYFLPNGRSFVTSVVYSGSEKVPDDDSFWGTYYIGSESKVRQWGSYEIVGDELRITWDDDSVTKAALLDGRRVLKEGKSVLENVLWAQESVKKGSKGVMPPQPEVQNGVDARH